MLPVSKKAILLLSVASALLFSCPDSSAQVETPTQRANTLLASMTTQQKIGQIESGFRLQQIVTVQVSTDFGDDLPSNPDISNYDCRFK